MNEALDDALDDVHTRFILNLPPAELLLADRLFFQLEQAHWFYTDFLVDSPANNDELDAETGMPNPGYGMLPDFKTLKSFAKAVFEMSPILSPRLNDFPKLWEEFQKYKRNITVYGLILMTGDCEKVVLCRTWEGNSWTWPAGKMNQAESGLDAAVREAYEETGFDLHGKLGPSSAEPYCNYQPRWTLPNEDCDSISFQDGPKRRTMFIVHNVPKNFPFMPVSRKEVSEVQFFDWYDLPNKQIVKTFGVLPFLTGIRRWIRTEKRSVWKRLLRVR